MSTVNPKTRPQATLITDPDGFKVADVHNNALDVNVVSGGGGGGNAAAGPTGMPVPADADFVGFEDNSGNLVGVSAANPLPVTGSLVITNPVDPALGTPVSFTSATPTGPVGASFACDGYGNCLLKVVVTGSVTAGEIALEGSIDGGTTWVGLRLIFEDSANGVLFSDQGNAFGAISLTSINIAVPEFYRCFIAGYKLLRFNLRSAIVGAGTLTITPQLVSANVPIYIGTEDIADNFTGKPFTDVFLASGGTDYNTSTAYPNQVDANGTQYMAITDGTPNGPAAVKPASTAAIATDPALVVAISPNNSVAVTGTVTTTPPSNASTNVTQFGGNNVVTGTGAGGVGIPRVTVSNDSVVGLATGANTIGKVDILATRELRLMRLPAQLLRLMRCRWRGQMKRVRPVFL